MRKRVLAVLFCLLTAQGCAEVSTSTTSVSGPLEGATSSSASSTDNVSPNSGTVRVQAQKVVLENDGSEDSGISSEALLEEININTTFDTFPTNFSDIN